MKPTHGLVPYTGVADTNALLDHVGPMAKTVRDCALMLEVHVHVDWSCCINIVTVVAF